MCLIYFAQILNIMYEKILAIPLKMCFKRTNKYIYNKILLVFGKYFFILCFDIQRMKE